MKSLSLSQSNGLFDAAQERIHSNVAVAVAAAQLVQPLLQLHRRASNSLRLQLTACMLH